MKVQLTYYFDNEDEVRAHLTGEARAAASPLAERAREHFESQETIAVEEIHIGRAAEAEPETAVSADALDGDQMPYDAAVHSDPPSFTADGLWRAKRGKGEEAKAARAAFKARGGAVAAPADLPTEAAPAMALPGMPGMPTAKAALPADAPEPIGLDRVIEKISGMITRAQITEQTLAGLYVKHSGVADPAASFNVFNTNESARASLYGDLCQIEPELS
jgi:hypothetical protein